jgi:agmatine deiminase
VPAFYRRWIETLAETVTVNVIGDPACRATANLPANDRVNWFEIPTNDCWIRDYGPTFLASPEPNTSADRPAAIEWRYNAWGGKYEPWDLDDAAAAHIIEATRCRRVPGGLCLEGGALEWDGRGRLLTSSNCLVTATRNPEFNHNQIADRLHRAAGAVEILWVDGGGLIGDDTDGHIDQLARFIDPKTIVVAVCDDPQDPNHEGLEENYRLIRRWAADTSPKIDVHRLPIPPARFVDGQRVPESYCNFLRVGPERLLVPRFGDRRSDDRAIGLLRDLARQRTPQIEVLSLDCRDLIWGLGALHCASLNQPA